MKRIAIIGSGFSSLSAACYFAKEGQHVTLYEQFSEVGGRARQLKRDGFVFDMGPTWYWMPDVFERFFADFNKRVEKLYKLEKLDPAYRVYFDRLDHFTINGSMEQIVKAFEKEEPGSSIQLKKFINSAAHNYEIAIKDLVYRPGISPFELVTRESLLKLDQFFSTVSKKVRQRFRNDRLIKILEFPVLFLGAKPSKTPAFYSFMNYADFGLGTFYPAGGMFSVVEAMKDLAIELGVDIKLNHKISRIPVEGKRAKGVVANGKFIEQDIIVSGADYHHTEQLIPPEFRQYTENYWASRTFAPSALLFYVGFSKKLENVDHHTLFFDVDFDAHSNAIYDHPKWPEKPLFYASFPSITDPALAPDSCEAAIFLIPLAPGLEDNPELRKRYFDNIIDRFDYITNQDAKNYVIFKESFCVNDFVSEYNSYKGNAYGLANTLKQTAFLRPKLKSKKVRNLFFTGQLTVPGPGVPPALISGKLVAGLVEKEIENESTF